jgi:uncharacterized RDD family membrane protein YckC
MSNLPSIWQPANAIQPPDPLAQPELYEGVTLKRIVAYLVDAFVLGLILVAAWFVTGFAGLLTFGLLLPFQPLVLGLIPIAYHTLLVGGERSATLGMRLLGLRVHSLIDGAGKPTMLQAGIQAVTFYGSMALTGSLVLLVVFFNRYRRTLHDYLSGTIVLNRVASTNQ